MNHKIKWPLEGQYYCTIFYFAHGFEEVNKLCDTEAACVNIALALCLKRKCITTGPKNSTKSTTHT
jgi:hypothetical protein